MARATAIELPLMAMPMMQVRIVRVLVAERFVAVNVRVWL